METSDSECFESADEEFYSDNEQKNSRPASAPRKLTQPKAPEVEKLSIEDTKAARTDQQHQQETRPDDNNRLADKKASKPTAASATPKEPPTKPERKEKQPRTKLGVKLGSKIRKSDLNLPESDDGDGTGKVASDSNKNEERSDLSNHAEGLSISERNGNVVNDDDKSISSVLGEQDRLDSQDTNLTNDENELEPKKSHVKPWILPPEEENMWEDDDWEPLSDTTNTVNENTNDKQIKSSNLKTEDFNSSWRGWGNWGVSSLLSSATVGVTTITNHVSQGLSTVLESGMGVPEPEELARLHREEKEKGLEPDGRGAAGPNLSFGLGHLVSGVSLSHITKLVETTSTKVISGGLDTLETIGKKTMEVLQEGDPGLKKKRAFLKIDADKPVLSHILREAKEKAEDDNKLLEEKRFAKKANYELLFDDHQGLVHLEALEMLSRQCDIKLQTLLESQSGSELTEMQETMSQVAELCELTEEEEEEVLDVLDTKEKLNTAVAEMNVPIAYDKLISTWVDAEEWLKTINLNICDDIELHEQAIDTLAQLTAIAVEQFHKIGELLLVKEHRSTADEADSLVQLTTILTTLMSNVATKLADKLNEKASSSLNKDRISSLITNVYYEAANSSSYIKGAFQLLIPVLQVGAV